MAGLPAGATIIRGPRRGKQVRGLGKGPRRGAAEEISIGVVLEEENAYALLQQGKKLLEEGKAAEAAFVLERARAIEPRKGSILEVLGRAYFKWGRYREAARGFSEAIEVDPTNDYAHYCLGLCLLKLRRNVEAGVHFKIAWSLKPGEMYREKAARFGAAAGDS